MSNFDFILSSTQMEQISAQVIDKAKQRGATDAQVELAEVISLSADVLNSQVENFESSYDSNLSVVVLIGKHKGSASITKFDDATIDQAIAQAIDIAKYTEADEANNLLAHKYLLQDKVNDDYLQLYHPTVIDSRDMVSQAIALEQIVLGNSQIKQSDGASLSYSWYNFLVANTNGFCNGYKTTRYNKTVSLIAENEHGMQTDYAYDSTRSYLDLQSNAIVANRAIDNCLLKLTRYTGTVTPGKYSIIFINQLSSKIISSIAAGLSGGSLYRKLSFLNDSMGKLILPNWLNITEDPFITKGLSSCYFDNEGYAVKSRELIKDGCVNGYLLSNYTATKMDLEPTGNAGGAHNLVVNSNFSGDYLDMASTLKQGLIVLETIGHGLNMVTGDYSVGASGLWVENGEICGYVDNLTIAGNLTEILHNIDKIGTDILTNTGIRCGSMLIQDCIQISN